MANKAPTIYDVANLSGVSAATVSRVLNDPSKVAEDKRQKVLDAIKSLNFVPKADAVITARKLYKKICVIAPFFTQPVFMQRLRGIESVFNGEHYELVIYSIENSEDLRDYISTITVTSRCDGLIILSLNPEEESMEILRHASFPVCFVECAAENFDCVIIPNVEGGKKAAEYFHKKGCKRPGFIGEKSTLKYTVAATEERLLGYREYFLSEDIEISKDHIWIGEFTKDELDAGLSDYLSQSELPDCVLCSSDLIAARFISLCYDRGIEIGTDIKVMGFDNIDIASYIGLSSVSQSLDESGRIAARCILNRMQNPDGENFSMLAPIKIIERKTT